MLLGTEVGLGPGHIVLDGDPALPTERGTAAPTFGTFIVAKRSSISATAELLLLRSWQSVNLLYIGPPFPLNIAPSHGASGLLSNT